MGGLGAFVGGLVMSLTGGPRRRMRGVISFAFMASASLILAGASQSLLLIGTGAFLAAAGLPLINGCAQAIWQVKIAPEVQGRVFAFRRLLGQASIPIALLAAGPLTDHLFAPLMSTGGALEPSLGPWLGTGQRGGIALIYLILATVAFVIGLVGSFSRSLNRLEQDLPDVVRD
jgi:hypothetical protein